MDYRQRIIEEAAQMFRTYGIRAVTMDMLANQMSISKRTIYEVFSDKDELLEGVIEWMAIKQKETMANIFSESENVVEAIFRMLSLMEDHFNRMSPAFLLDMKRFHNKVMQMPGGQEAIPYVSSNAEILKRGIDEGVFRNDINIDLTNKCMLEVAKISNDQQLFPPGSFNNSDVVKNFYINYLRGISTAKGLKLINQYENSGILTSKKP
jgi:AcrR family transcriptional regulator